MEDNSTQIGSLIEKLTEYSKTSYELFRLKSIDKASDVISSLIPKVIVFVLFASFMLFFNLGLAFWLGTILGSNFYGFFIVAGFYAVTGVVMHIFMHQWLKKVINNFIIKLAIK